MYPLTNNMAAASHATRAGEKLRRQGHHNSIQGYILRDRVRSSIVMLSEEAFEAMVWQWAQLQARQRRKRV